MEIKFDCALEGETFKVPVIALSKQCEVVGNIFQNQELLF